MLFPAPLFMCNVCVCAAGEWHGATFWLVVCGAAAFVVVLLAAFACWVARRRNSLAHKLGKYGIFCSVLEGEWHTTETFAAIAT